MPRRPAVVTPEIPLFLVDPVVRKELKKAGEELVRMVVKKVKGHYYDISVRTRTICHPLQSVPRAGNPSDRKEAPT
jgi:hypothetical protein